MPDATSIVSRARSLRRDMTDVERRLWHRLRDFASRDARLIVELDGSQHADSSSDERRDRFLLEQGFRVLRFWNQEVSGNLDGVCETMLAAVEGRLEPYDRYKVR